LQQKIEPVGGKDNTSKGRDARTCRYALERFYELIYAKTRLANDSAQCTPVEFLMIRHDDLSKWIITAQDYMAAFLTFNAEASFLQRLNALAA